MDINEPENDDRSWSLFDSSANSLSSEPFQDNFEEVNYYNDIQDPESDSSYEIIEDSLNEAHTDIVTPMNNNNQVEGQVFQEEFIENHTHSKAREDFSNIIKSTADNVLNSRPKQEEIKCFENLLRRFDKWFLEKKERKYLRDRGYAQETDFGDSEVPTCKFLVHNTNINAFVFPFSDVYVNIVVNKNSHKHRVQSLFAEFLREVEPQSFTREYDFKSRKNNRKLIFKFSQGNTKFIITVGLDFRVRLNHYIKLCTSIDERFLTMGAFLSYWAYKRNIFNEKYLNPYGLYFMIIYFLMTRNPSILPKFDDDDLQKMHSSKPLFSGGFKSHNKSIIVYKEKMNSNTNARSNKPSSQASTNEEDPSKVTLGELVMQFFSMFTIEIPNLGRTISVKRGAPIFCGRTIPGYSVEDPFNPQYDLCRNLNDDRCKGYITVKSEFERAHKLILEGKVQELCQERKC